MILMPPTWPSTDHQLKLVEVQLVSWGQVWQKIPKYRIVNRIVLPETRKEQELKFDRVELDRPGQPETKVEEAISADIGIVMSTRKQPETTKP